MTQTDPRAEGGPLGPLKAAGGRRDSPVVEEVQKVPLSKLETAFAIRRRFSNWYMPVLLLAVESYLHVHRPIAWRSRSGKVFVTAGDGSSFPVREIFLHDEYRLESLSPAPAHILDIGANVGVFALRATELFPGVRISAFEPSPRAYELLVQNLRTNSALGKIDAHRCAVVGSSDVGDVQFWVDATGSPCSTLIESAVRDRKAGHWEKVPAVSLSSILASAGAVDLLKLDVEGAEYEIMRETSPEALVRVRRIVVEYHPLHGHHFTDIVEALAAAGFRMVRHRYFAELADTGLLWFDRGASSEVT